MESNITKKYPELVFLNKDSSTPITKLFFIYEKNPLYKNIWQFRICRENPKR